MGSKPELPPRKIAVYDDNPDFGGHQVMSLHGVESLLERPNTEVTFFLNTENVRLTEKLDALHSRFPRLEIQPTHLRTRKLQALRNPFLRSQARGFSKVLRDGKFDTLLVCQGDIEDGCQGAWAGRMAGIDVVSYIPVPHSLHEMGAKLGQWRDVLNRPLFDLPSRYITISESMRALLRQRGSKQPIIIVENGVDVHRFKPTEHQRDPNALPKIALVGRIEYKQKQQDWALKAFTEHDTLKHFQLTFAGSGPDQDDLDEQIKAHNQPNRISRLKWIESPEQLYAESDVILIPSAFEGVPLVMLEALCMGRPVVASRRDGMRDTLPEDWLFDFQDSDGLAEALKRAMTDSSLLHRESAQARKRFSLERFKKDFAAAVLQVNGC